MLHRTWLLMSLLFSALIVCVSISPSLVPAVHSMELLSLVKSIPLNGEACSIAVNSTTNRAYISYLDRPSIDIVNGISHSLFGSPIPVSAYELAINQKTNQIYTTSLGDSVTVIDGQTNVSSQISVPDGFKLDEIGVNTSSNRVYVLNHWGNISVIDGATNKATTPITDTEDYPFGIAVNSSTNRIYFSNSRSKEIKVADGNTHTVSNLGIHAIDYIGAMDVNPVTNKIYAVSLDGDVKGSHLTVVDGNTNSIEKTIDFGSGVNVFDVAVNPNNNHIYVSSRGSVNAVWVVEGTTHQILGRYDSGLSKPTYLDVNIATNEVYLLDHDAKSLVVLDDESGAGVNGVTPLIFIPGMMGSVLVENLGVAGSEKERWPAVKLDLTDIGKESLLLPSSRNIQATYPVERVYDILMQKLRSVYHETGFPDETPYERCQQSNQSTTLYMFAYDWRQDISNSSDVGPVTQLKKLINCIRDKHQNTKVNILTHSMGGLVARRYILDNPDHHVDKLVTIAAPWLGAPQFLNALLTGDALQGDLLTALGTKLHNDAIMKLVATFPGGWELAPSQSYFDLGGSKPLREDTGFLGLAPGTPYNYDTYRRWLDTHYPDVTRPGQSGGAGSVGHQFHTLMFQQDNWKEDTTGISYFHIYGLGTREDTVYSLRNGWHPLCYRTKIDGNDIFVCPSIPGTGIPVEVQGFYIDKWGSGDQTVPMLSANRIGTDDINAPRARVFIAKHGVDDNEPQNTNTIEHSSLPKNSNVQDCILYFLLDVGNCNLSEVTRSSANAMQAIQPQLADTAYYVNVRGVTNVTVNDSFGNSTSTTSGTLTTPVPGIAIQQMLTGQYLVLPDDQTYTISFQTGIDPLFIEVKHGTGSTSSQVVRYSDLTLPANVRVQLIISQQEIKDLHYDDGSGAFAHIVSPTISVEGSQANYTEPPTVSVAATGASITKTVTISANAIGQGNTVRNVRYSLDGRTFKQYNQPFQVNTLQYPTLYVFADDSIANRSPLLVKRLDYRVYIPLVSH